MEDYKLNSEIREGSGKGVARKLRAKGQVPAILYGQKEQALSLSLSELQIRKILQAHPESAILDLSIEGAKPSTCNAIVREIQRHPSSGRLLHLDLQRIRMDEKVRVQVPILLNGDAVGVKEMGGILDHSLREINVNCLPTAIPKAVEVDVSELGIGDAIHVSDIATKYPDFEFLDDEETLVANVVPPKIEAAPEVEEEEGLEEPELVDGEKAESEGDKPAAEEKGDAKQE